MKDAPLTRWMLAWPLARRAPVKRWVGAGYIYIYIYIYIGEPFDEIDHTGALSPQTHNTRTPTSNLTYESTLGLPTKYVY